MSAITTLLDTHKAIFVAIEDGDEDASADPMSLLFAQTRAVHRENDTVRSRPDS